MFTVFRQISRLLKTSNKRSAKFIHRFHRDNADNVVHLDDRTLTGRFLLYMNNLPHQKPELVQNNETDKLILFKDNAQQLMKCDTPQLFATFNILAHSHTAKDNLEHATVLTDLDSECCRRLERLSCTETLEFLHLFMKAGSNRMLKFKFYKLAIEKLLGQLQHLNRTEVVQLIFFAGLQKMRAKNLLRKCMHRLDESFINNLTIEDICIICNSTFKASTKINNPEFLNSIVEYLNGNLYLLKDPALFVTLVKTIRHNRCQTDELLASISCTIFFNKTLEYYSFSALCHILALYSDFLYYDEFVPACANRCLELLKNSTYSSKHAYLEEQPRLKDIKRLLWCLSNLNYKHLDRSDIRNVIVTQVMKRIEGGETEEDPSSLIEIMLYLWMLDYRAYELVPHALTEQNVADVQGLKSRAKDRLNLLLSCFHFEDPDLLKTLKIRPRVDTTYNPSFQLEKRPLLQTVVENLKVVARKQDIDRYELGFQIPGLNVLGITGYRKRVYKAVHIEVLDEFTTLKNSDEVPSGPMQLKLRILGDLEEGLIVISSAEASDISDSEMQELLLDEIDLVC